MENQIIRTLSIGDDHYVVASLKDGELSAVEEKLEAIEEKLDELSELIRTEGLARTAPTGGPYNDPYWGDPYNGDGGL